jgi:hypothetical protein
MHELKEALLTRDLVKFESVWNETELPTGRFTIAAHVVRTAVKAGWFANGTTPEQIDEMTPLEVLDLQTAVNEKYSQATVVDPN